MMTFEETLKIYEKVTSQTAPPVNKKALQSILLKPYATRSGLPAYPTLFNKIAVCMQGMLFEKPFEIHNREVALQCVQYMLQQHSYVLRASNDDIESFVHGIEIGFTTWHRITAWLKQHTVRRQFLDDENTNTPC